MDLEFLVRATGAVPKGEYADWIEKGRRKQAASSESKSKWQAVLPSGTVFQFIGICNSPSGSRQWWGPDGGPLEAAPYFNSESFLRKRDGQNAFEIAWRLELPPGATSSATTCSLEGCTGSGYRQLRDRYGYPLSATRAEGYAFEKSREKTTLRLRFAIGGQPEERITLENLSLVPGKDFGARLEVEK